jgi:hypothetical protein
MAFKNQNLHEVIRNEETLLSKDVKDISDISEDAVET